MPHLAPAVVAAIIGGGAGLAGTAGGVIAANKAAQQKEDMAKMFQMKDPANVPLDQQNFGNDLVNQNANLTLRPGGRSIVFPNKYY